MQPASTCCRTARHRGRGTRHGCKPQNRYRRLSKQEWAIRVLPTHLHDGRVLLRVHEAAVGDDAHEPLGVNGGRRGVVVAAGTPELGVQGGHSGLLQGSHTKKEQQSAGKRAANVCVCTAKSDKETAHAPHARQQNVSASNVLLNVIALLGSQSESLCSLASNPQPRSCTHSPDHRPLMLPDYHSSTSSSHLDLPASIVQQV